MHILTQYPVRVVKERKRYSKKDFQPTYAYADDFYGIDGKNVNQVKAFQDWLDMKGIKWVKATNADRNNGSYLNKGSGYGTYGQSTTNAYKVYGSQWESSVVSGSAPIAPASTNQATQNTTSKPAPSSSNNVPVPTAAQVPPTTKNIEKMKKKGLNWDKAKGVWSKAKGVWGKAEETGILGKVGDYLGVNLGNNAPLSDGGAPVDTNSTGEDTDADSKGSGLKKGLIIGGVVVAVAILYMVSRSKGTSK